MLFNFLQFKVTIIILNEQKKVQFWHEKKKESTSILLPLLSVQIHCNFMSCGVYSLVRCCDFWLSSWKLFTILLQCCSHRHILVIYLKRLTRPKRASISVNYVNELRETDNRFDSLDFFGPRDREWERDGLNDWDCIRNKEKNK